MATKMNELPGWKGGCFLVVVITSVGGGRCRTGSEDARRENTEKELSKQRQYREVRKGVARWRREDERGRCEGKVKG